MLKFMFQEFLSHFICPKVLSTGTPKIINFPFVPKGKSIIFGVQIIKPIRVTDSLSWFDCSTDIR